MRTLSAESQAKQGYALFFHFQTLLSKLPLKKCKSEQYLLILQEIYCIRRCSYRENGDIFNEFNIDKCTSGTVHMRHVQNCVLHEM